MNKKIIGSQEWCSLPGLNIPAIKARTDSGAKTSSIHAFNIHAYEENGELLVEFEINPLQKDKKTTIKCKSKVVDERFIKSSSGTSEKRYVIKEIVKIGDGAFEIELTLNNRDSMGFKMLLGREAMTNRFIVDPSLDFCMGEFTEEHVKSLYGGSINNEKSLKIALLASNPELYSNKRIIEAAQMRGHQITFLKIKHCYIKMDAIRPEVHYRGKQSLDEFDAIIPRIKPSMTFYGISLLRQFEAMNTFCLNSSLAITQSRDKLFSSQLFLSNGIDIPITGFANSPLDTDDLIKMVGGAPLIIKLLEGTAGRGVVLAETDKASESVINAFKSLKANILVQEFIKEANGRDIRCIVIGGKVIASMQRVAKDGEYRANLHRGASAEPVKLTKEEKNLAIKAAKVLGLHVAGVDIIRSNRGPLILEVNSSPGLEGIERISEIDIANIMIETIEKKFGFSK